MHKQPDVVERARQGDQAAFRQLVEEHQGLVRSTVAGMLGVGAAEADDVAQEVFIRFYKALQDFRGEAQVGTYLSRIAINLSINELKRRQRRNRWLSVASRENETHQEDLSMNPGRQDLRETLRRALQLLGPDFRAVVVLRLIDGYSVKETAEILGLPQGTVASRLARGQQKLREVLEKWL